MSDDAIFLKLDGKLVALRAEPYDNEALLQEALAAFPEVLAGPSTTGDSGSLLLIEREVGIPSEGEGSAVFSLDHLFVDSSGIPVLVEVKRSSDTRIRREVVGQMLDYAANAVQYLPIKSLQERLEARARAAGKTVDELLGDIGVDQADEYWGRVEGNLSVGKIRMLIVSDSIPDRLTRIIEFLNEQMRPAEILGVEVPQYVGGGQTVYVPRVIGRTSAAVNIKPKSSQTVPWDKESFLEAMNDRCDENGFDLVCELIANAEEYGLKLSWGSVENPGVAGWYSIGGKATSVWQLHGAAVGKSPYLIINLGEIRASVDADRLAQAASILEGIPELGTKVGEAKASAWRKNPRPRVSLSVVAVDANKQALMSAIAELLSP